MTVMVRIENDYADGYHSETDVELPAPGADVEAWWDELVWPLTGDGHGRSLDACYTATILAGDAGLVGLSMEWV